MSDIVQKGNVASGDIAGRDILKVTVPQTETHFSRLNDQIRRDLEADPDTRVFVGRIERLESYTQEQPGAIRGLPQKLQEAGLSMWQQDATRLKETFAKRMYENSLSLAMQELLVLVLAMVEQRFRTYLRPLIDGGASGTRLQQAIIEEIVNPIINQLAGNYLRLMPDELEGAVWYLTGNCYMRWISSARVSSGA